MGHERKAPARWRTVVALGLLTVSAVAWQSREAVVVRARSRPDIVVIVTDDQRWDTMGAMPLTTAWLPTGYPEAFVSNPMCCPSRTTILTGTYSHTNGVWTNSPPYGGWPTFAANGLPGRTIADALHASGYRTALVGKFMNRWDGTIPPGWDVFAAHLQARAFPGTSSAPYYDYTLRVSVDGAVSDENHGEAAEDYSTTVMRSMATDIIRATPLDQPLFLYLAPSAPHSSGGGAPPIPAPEDVGARVTVPVPSPNVNEADVADKPAYIASRSLIPESKLVRWQRAQLRSLYSLDRAIDDILTTISATRDISNTLVILLGDNGFANGSHRWFSKAVPYEEAIRVPMRARFDGVLPPGDDGRLVTNLDIAPTIAEAAGVVFPVTDGESLLRAGARSWFVVEGPGGSRAFCGVRTATAKYVRYASGEEEYYDLVNDPFELESAPMEPGAVALRELAAASCSPLPPGWPRTEL